jgi:RHS repeat-associated protein
VVTNHAGNIYERFEYTPYGEVWIAWANSGVAHNEMLPFRFTGKELDEETGLYYYGARYLDPKVSRWLSADPALGEYIPSAPVNDEARRRNGSLPGMGGVFNYVNLHAYHYAGNNPVRYTDPDGRHPNPFNLIFANPDKMTKEDARQWITENVINDNDFPICQRLYSLAMNGNSTPLYFNKDSYIAKQMASDDGAYVNARIFERLNFPDIDFKIGYNSDMGSTRWTSGDLTFSFNHAEFSWTITGYDKKTRTASILIKIFDAFNFGSGEGVRNLIAEKLTLIGKKAELSSFEITVEYELKMQVPVDIEE